MTPNGSLHNNTKQNEHKVKLDIKKNLRNKLKLN